jgi:hypothetical protein
MATTLLAKVREVGGWLCWLQWWCPLVPALVVVAAAAVVVVPGVAVAAVVVVVVVAVVGAVATAVVGCRGGSGRVMLALAVDALVACVSEVHSD